MDSFGSDEMAVNSGDDSFDHLPPSKAALELEVRKLIGESSSSASQTQSSSKLRTGAAATAQGKYFFRTMGVAVVDGQQHALHSSGIPPSPRTGTISTGTPRAGGGVAGSVSENALRQAIVVAQRTILSGQRDSASGVSGASASASSAVAATPASVPAPLSRIPSAVTIQSPQAFQRRSSSRNTLGGVLLEQRQPQAPLRESTGHSPLSQSQTNGGSTCQAGDKQNDRPCGQCGGLVTNHYALPSEVPELEKRLVQEIQFYAKSLRRI